MSIEPWRFVIATGQLVMNKRIAAGLTQVELAQKAGIKRSALANIEVGRRTPSFQNIAQIARALDCSVEALTPQEHPA